MAQTPPGDGESSQSPPPATRSMWLWIILGAYLVLASAAAWLMPLSNEDPRWPQRTRQKFIPPDEQAHVGYVEYLIDHRRLPVFDDPDANYEAHQPPIFYLSSIPAYLAGHAVGEVLTPDDPLRMATLALRLWCVIIGVGVIWAVFILARWLFPDSDRLALATTGFAALLPMHWVNLAGVTNDGMAELAATVCLIASCRLAAMPNLRRAATLGALLGVGLLVKSSLLALAPVAALAVVLADLQGDVKERILRGLKLGAVVFGVMLIICGAWWVRNQMLYGDPLAQTAFVELFSKDRATPEWFLERGVGPSAYLMLVAVTTMFSYWGVFGQAVIAMPAWYYLIGFVLWIPMAVGIIKAWWRVRTAEEWSVSTPWVLCGVAAVMAGLVLLKFNMSFFQAQARYLFIAIGPLAAIFVGGWWEALWAEGDTRLKLWRVASAIIFTVLCLLAVTALYNLQPSSPVRLLPVAGM